VARPGGAAGTMTGPRDEGVWRDEERLPLDELTDAVAAPAADGQVDDATGGDAGAEDEFGHGPHPKGEDRDGRGPPRPSTTGRTGPA
jgi:hypothetical protein